MSFIYPLLKSMQELQTLKTKTTATGQMGHWYSDYMDYKYVLQKQMISKYSDVSCLPDSPSICLSWLRTPCHATVWLSCFLLVFLAAPHEINSKQQNKIFLKAENSHDFYVLTTILLFTRIHITMTNKCRVQRGVLRIKAQSFWALSNHKLAKTLNQFCFLLFSSLKRK